MKRKPQFQMKQLPPDSDDQPTQPPFHNPFNSHYQNQSSITRPHDCPFPKSSKHIDRIYIGSLCTYGNCEYKAHTRGLEQQYKIVSLRGSEILKIANLRTEDIIQIWTPFSLFFDYVMRIAQLGVIKFYAQISKPSNKHQKQIQQEEYQKQAAKLKADYLNSNKKKDRKNIQSKLRQIDIKINATKHRAKKIVAVRMQIFINRNIFTQQDPSYSNNLKRLDQLQTLINTLRPASQEYKAIKQTIERLITDQLYFQKVSRSFLLYLIQKCKVRVLNRSFIKPPPKLNYLMREYRRITIGLITKNKRAERRIQMKIQGWKLKFQYFTGLNMCISQNNLKAYKQDYYPSISALQNQKQSQGGKGSQCVFWNKKYTGFGLEMLNNQVLKLQIKNGIQSGSHGRNRQFLIANRRKIMKQIGAHGFDDQMDVGVANNDSSSSSDDQDQNQQNQASKKTMDADQYKLMKKNQALMQKFQTQNKYFKIHPTPDNMISQLKPYQGQALQWMKYREGKITVQSLFQQKYQQQIEDFQFQRKLSPFWQQIETISKQKFYINYLTGQFTKVFHDWKTIKGGILADEMGLGKTVMTLSLLADQQWQGVNLIVVPVAVLLQWKDQIKKHCGDQIKVYEFHSDAKKRRKIDLTEYNIVLITYPTLGHEYRAFKSKNPQSNQKFLFEYNFQRIILDQAHNIRGTNTLQFNAVMNLQGRYSWCLTGTLIQNSQQDLFAIFKFLRVQVFSQESWWNQYIKNAGCTQAKMNVIQTVLRPIVLRRTKASTSNDGQAIISLTKKNIHVIRPEFTKVQAQLYQKLQTGAKRFFRSNLQAGRNYTHVFQIISKLRQFCCHPALIFGTDIDQLQQKDIQKAIYQFLQGRGTGQSFKQQAVSTMMKADETCVICLQPAQQNAVLTKCGHYFCQPCIKRTLSVNPTCPVCRSVLSQASYIKKSDFMGAQDYGDLQESSKVTAILEVLQQIRKRKQKCVVFTQWIKIITILSEKLTIKQVQFETITGGMTVQKRQKAIKRFREKPNINFLIVSIRAGATGLNLAFANNVAICDPWWNPSHEDQAIGRVHRIGQTQDVNVYRFIMRKSIEQKIQKMHDGKRKLADQVMMKKGSLQESKTSAAEELIRLLQS